MLDHIGLKVSDLAKSKAFYEQALAPLRYKPMKVFPEAVGFGDKVPDFWIGAATPGAPPTGPIHLAFGVHDRETVDAFHAAALAAGGKDHGKPGLRPQYHPDYYGAFVLDPDGNNVEAVCHRKV